jgi:uncharacterized protein
MAVDHIRYDILAQEALRGMVRTVLADAAKKGLPGDHHFYVSFDTRADGVRLSPRVRAQYPEEMTIVLQHQFWDLIVSEDGFEVGLSFGGVPERLVVPFAAIKAFIDPSVQFGLQFAAEEQPAAADDEAKGVQDARPPAEHKHSRVQPTLSTMPTPANPPPAPEAADEEPDKPDGGGGQVVRLDRFRNKGGKKQ